MENMEKDIKLNAKDFVKELAVENELDYDTLKKSYDIIIKGIVDKLCTGHRLSLDKFGNFTAQIHKGHAVQNKGITKRIDDYYVMKFKPSRSINQKINEEKLGRGVQSFDD